ncbi:hypothetical protein RAS1_08640 [Phycisphaerae bacterium RAS1]|nr:hypothetical protein RAS1_08640 [Phycisphaerae bacterium RAS1]
MAARRKQTTAIAQPSRSVGYDAVLGGIVDLLEAARRTSVRAVNALITATYWDVGRRIVEHEQAGASRAEYGEALLRRLAADLTARFGRGFGYVNLTQMRRFFLNWPHHQILQTPSEESPARNIVQTAPAQSPDLVNRQTPSGDSSLSALATRFPLPWSHYVKLLSLKNPLARRFYESEALRGGWSVRQLERQISTQFYERTALSRDTAALLRKGEKSRPDDTITVDEEIKDPYVLEFLNLKDEYSETDLEDALIHQLETFLLELGGDFAFVGRQRRLRIGDEWYRVDLLFFHRRLRCLIVIDLKLGRFTHADAGQMHLYLNFAREHWVQPGENPPVGLILCAQKDAAVARYALEGLPNKVVAAEYRTALPDERLLAQEIERTRAALERRGSAQPTPRRPSSKRKRGRHS